MLVWLSGQVSQGQISDRSWESSLGSLGPKLGFEDGSLFAYQVLILVSRSSSGLGFD